METLENHNQNYWSFIENYYPNYYSCDDVLLSDILLRKLDGETICAEDEKMIKNWIIKETLLEINKKLFSKALANYLNLTRKFLK